MLPCNSYIVIVLAEISNHRWEHRRHLRRRNACFPFSVNRRKNSIGRNVEKQVEHLSAVRSLSSQITSQICDKMYTGTHEHIARLSQQRTGHGSAKVMQLFWTRGFANGFRPSPVVPHHLLYVMRSLKNLLTLAIAFSSFLIFSVAFSTARHYLWIWRTWTFSRLTEGYTPW